MGELTLVLLAEKRKGSGSFWAAMIQALPSVEEYKEYYPTFVDKALLKSYSGLPFVSSILHRQDQLESRWLVLKEANFLPDLSWDELRWADAAVCSRLHGSDELGYVMIPFADLVNNAEPGNMLWQRHMEGGFFVFR